VRAACRFVVVAAVVVTEDITTASFD